MEKSSLPGRRDFLKLGGIAATTTIAAKYIPRAVAASPKVPTNATELCYTPATELAVLIRNKQISPVELTEAVLDRVAVLNPKLNAFLYVDYEGARAAARAAENAVMKGDRTGALHGIPVSIKDSHKVKGMPTTNGSKITGTARATEDALLTARTRAAGAIIFGKTNLPAFAHLDLTQNLLAPPCPNPWNLKYNSGGSSGGAGAAAAAGLGPLHHGTDGGGSIRIPADRCGIFGFKPSTGRIAHPGAFGSGAGVGHDGPMTRTVADAALLMNVWAGASEYDFLSIDREPDDYLAAIARWEKALKGKRVGLTFDYGWVKVVDPEVRRLVTVAAAKFADLGCVVEEVSPKWPNPLRAWERNWYATAASKRFLFKDHPDWLDPTLVPMMDFGDRISGIEMTEMMATRDAVFQSVQRFFDRYDLLLSPVTATPTFPFDAIPTSIDGISFSYLDAYAPLLLGRMPFTPTFNMTGHPAASVPCGFTKNGLPVGLHVIGGWHQDTLVLQACAGFEAIQPWTDKRPSI